MYRSCSLVLVLALSLAPFAAACGTTDAAPAPSAPKAQPASTDPQALCIEVFTKNRTCTDTYLPALVDVRAKYDQPAGIADEVKADRAAVIAHAMQEWAGDSTDEAIAGTCAKITSSDVDPADQESARACLAKDPCSAYTTCIMPYFEKRFSR